MPKNKNTPSKAQIKGEKVLGAILPGSDGKNMRAAAKRHQTFRDADLSTPKPSMWKRLTG